MQELAAIKQQIAAIEQHYQRKPGSVSLLAASKGQSIEKMQAAYDAGQRHFGENYLQEALSKQLILTQKDIIWHFIGKIQHNKTRKIAAHFAWVHAVEDEKTVERLNAQRPETLSPLNICIAVNIDQSVSKSGLSPDKVQKFASFCQQLPRLRLRGLMTLPAPSSHFAEQRAKFHALNLLFLQLNAQGYQLDTLSMGMSDDFPAAIAEGATIVRIGSALFGPRTISG